VLATHLIYMVVWVGLQGLITSVGHLVCGDTYPCILSCRSGVGVLENRDASGVTSHLVELVAQLKLARAARDARLLWDLVKNQICIAPQPKGTIRVSCARDMDALPLSYHFSVDSSGFCEDNDSIARGKKELWPSVFFSFVMSVDSCTIYSFMF